MSCVYIIATAITSCCSVNYNIAHNLDVTGPMILEDITAHIVINGMIFYEGHFDEGHHSLQYILCFVFFHIVLSVQMS